MRSGQKVPDTLRWRVLELYSQHLSGRIIAERTGLPAGTVYRIIQEAKAQRG